MKVAEVPSRSPGRPAGTAVVVVTGAGGPAGVSVVRALVAAGKEVVGVDSDPSAAGLHLATRSAIVPRADDDRFVDVVLDVVRAAGAHAIIPTVAEEVLALQRASTRLQAARVAHFLPTTVAVERCLDKVAFSRILRDAGIATPPTTRFGMGEVPGPWIVKPRFGRGSRDVHTIDDAAELRYVVERIPEPIIQTRLSGREFTVDTLSGPDGDLLGAVPRWRLETRGGISTKGETFSSPVLVEAVAAVLRAVGLSGPANVQGFDQGGGRWSFVEVNPRFSGGLPLSLAAGADLVGGYLALASGERPSPESLSFRPGVRMTRYFEEIFAP